MKTFVLFFLLALSSLVGAQFTIDYDADTFLMDGKPFQYFSGSTHYFRMPRQYWRDRLKKMKAAGLNTVSTYVEWSQHEREPGQYDFSGDLNITEYIRTAEEEGLYVILRVGPFICAERDMGGFPYWLLRDYPDIELRVNDPRYVATLEKWLDILLPHISSLLYGNGGPIITIQVENEYGFSGHCDHDYTSWLVKIFQKYIGDKAVLFTTDGSDYGSLSCGKIEGAYATVDFGPGANVTQMYLNHKAVEPKGPFVDSEYYPGWLTHWGRNWERRSTDDVIKTFKEILDIKGNVNFYMFYGGTNFGFSAGANQEDTYVSDVTSYDYDAPITEAGDLTPKYSAIRDVLLQYQNISTVHPANSTKGDYGILNLKSFARMASDAALTVIGRSPVSSQNPLTFEAISQDQGYVLYQTKSPLKGQNVNLTADIRDFAHVYINGLPVGTLSRELSKFSIPVTVQTNDVISILVENLGRINIGLGNNDTKGLTNVQLGNSVLHNWNMTGYDFNNLNRLIQLCDLESVDCFTGGGFQIFKGSFIANITSDITYEGQLLAADSWFDVSALSKGVVFVNGHNLGRYWSDRGPQYSLYIPGAWLKLAPEINDVVWIEESETGDDLKVSFSSQPIYGDPKN